MTQQPIGTKQVDLLSIGVWVAIASSVIAIVFWYSKLDSRHDSYRHVVESERLGQAWQHMLEQELEPRTLAELSRAEQFVFALGGSGEEAVYFDFSDLPQLVDSDGDGYYEYTTLNPGFAFVIDGEKIACLEIETGQTFDVEEVSQLLFVPDTTINMLAACAVLWASVSILIWRWNHSFAAIRIIFILTLCVVALFLTLASAP